MFTKGTDLQKKTNYYFRILEVRPVSLTTYLLV